MGRTKAAITKDASNLDRTSPANLYIIREEMSFFSEKRAYIKPMVEMTDLSVITQDSCPQPRLIQCFNGGQGEAMSRTIKHWDVVKLESYPILVYKLDANTIVSTTLNERVGIGTNAPSWMAPDGIMDHATAAKTVRIMARSPSDEAGVHPVSAVEGCISS